MDEYEDIPSSESESAATETENDVVSGSSESVPSDAGSEDNASIIEQLELLGQKLDGIEGKLGHVKDDVSSLAAVGADGGSADMDYSGQLDALGQNVALLNVFMLVLLVGVFIVAGISLGNTLVRWFKYER